MSEALDGTKTSSEKKEEEDAGVPDDPLAEDPLKAASGRDLSDRLRHVIDDLEWRQIARDKQAHAITILEDLQRSAAEQRARWRASDDKVEARIPPKTGDEASELLGRLLLKCEDAMGELLARGGELARYGHISQIAHAAARLAQGLGQTQRAEARPSAPKPARKVRGKRP